MEKVLKNKDTAQFIALILFFLVIVFIFQSSRPQKRSVTISKEEMNYTLDPEVFSILSLGNQKLFSSYLWMTTLLFSDHEHVKDSKNSWMYHRFNLISFLNPYFYENYKYGGLYLSIIKDDLIGAEAIYKRGLEKFNNDEFLLWNRAFNLCMEMKRCDQAMPLFESLDKIGSTTYPLAGRIAAKIKAGLGFEEEAFNSLLSTYNKMSEGVIKKNTFKTLYILRAKIDLKCLNEKKKLDCNQFDIEGNPYKRARGKYVSNRPQWNEKTVIK